MIVLRPAGVQHQAPEKIFCRPAREARLQSIAAHCYVPVRETEKRPAPNAVVGRGGAVSPWLHPLWLDTRCYPGAFQQTMIQPREVVTARIALLLPQLAPNFINSGVHLQVLQDASLRHEPGVLSAPAGEAARGWAVRLAARKCCLTIRGLPHQSWYSTGFVTWYSPLSANKTKGLPSPDVAFNPGSW